MFFQAVESGRGRKGATDLGDSVATLDGGRVELDDDDYREGQRVRR